MRIIGKIGSMGSQGKASAGGGGGSLIPMAWNDPRFTANTPGDSGPFQSGALVNNDWNETPTYPNGDQCFTWNGDGADVLDMSLCRVDWREGPRVGAGTTPRARFNVDQCFINCVGMTGDHADGIQAYNPGGQALLNITNTCFRSYSASEALSVYGAGFVASDALFWADGFQGEVRMTNVLIWGGRAGMQIYSDGTTSIAFDHVYFVPSPGGWDDFPYDMTPGIATKWTEVRAATIVNGVIIPGALLPPP